MPTETPDPSHTVVDTAGLPCLDHLPAPEQVEAVLAHQRVCWGKGEPVPVARYLEVYPALRDDPEAAADIVYQDYVLRAKGEDPALFAEYVRQYPEHAKALRCLRDAGKIVEQVFKAGPPVSSETPPRRFGNYELLEEVGRGGMGVVWKARQVSLGRVVALKMILSGDLASDDAIGRFQNEARTVAKLRHPNIVAVHEVGAEGNLHYFSMDLVEGPTLAQMVRDNPLSPEKAARYVEGVARAIHHAHNHGVLHRDLNPSNVLIDCDDQPRVTDFGLARQVEGDQQRTGTGQVLGTPGYMPPEQATGRRGEVGPASDVYSLGAVLYELLTGRPPFQAASPFDTLMLVVEAEPVAPRALNPGIPRDLDTVCLKCLQKDSRRRYGSAEELAGDLARFLRGEPVSARPVGPVGRFWRWCRRYPVVAGLSAGLVAALLGGIVAVSWQLHRVEQHRADAEHQRDVAEEEGRRAQANLERAKDAVDFIGNRIGEIRLRHVPQVQEVQKEVLEYALKFHEGFLQERGDDPAVLWEAGKAWTRVGVIRAQLGRNDQAAAAYRQAIRLMERLPAEYPTVVDRTKALMDGHHRLYQLFVQTQQVREAIEIEPAVERLFAACPAEMRGDPAHRGARAALLGNKATRHYQLQQTGEAEALTQESLSVYRALVQEYPEDRRYKESLARTINRQAIRLKQTNRLAEARQSYEEALAIQKQLTERFPADPELLLDLATTCRNMGPLLRELKEFAQAEQMFARAEAAFLKLSRDFPGAPTYHNHLGEAYHSWALLRQDQRRPAEALALFEKAAASQRSALAPDPNHPRHRIALCKHCYQIAECHIANGDHERASRAAAEMAMAAGRIHDIVEAAVRFARCVSLAERDAKLPATKREEVVGGYAAQAVSALRRLLPGNLPELSGAAANPYLAPLRRYDEFNKLIGEVERKRPPK